MPYFKFIFSLNMVVLNAFKQIAKKKIFSYHFYSIAFFNVAIWTNKIIVCGCFKCLKINFNFHFSNAAIWTKQSILLLYFKYIFKSFVAALDAYKYITKKKKIWIFWRCHVNERKLLCSHLKFIFIRFFTYIYIKDIYYIYIFKMFI